MGKTVKGYNWKARQSNATYQHLVQPEVKVDIEVEKEKYDEANAFLLSSKKQKNKKALHKPVPEGKPLSKKQKKRLELTLKKKTAGQNRKQLLEKLKDVQATSKELSLMTSVAEAQTMGVKRLTSGLVKCKEEAEHKVPKTKINSIKGSYKRKNKERLIVRRESSTSLSDSDSEESIVAETVNTSMKSTEVHGQTESHIVCVNKTEVQTESTTVDDSSAEKEMQADSALLRKEETEKDQNILSVVSEECTAKSGGDKNPTVEVEEAECGTAQHLSVAGDASIESQKQKTVPAVHVPVSRTEEIQKVRSALPILSEEHTVMNAINKNPVVIIYGETGCGKTTQVPQFLFEAGYASGKSRIGVTEPRRIAATSMSQRVAHEMSLSSNEVSYKIRYEGNVTSKTKIKFMTDGVLLREIKDDFYLTKYRAIIIDEAHERTMQSDVLIGLLSRVVKFREKRGKPLKLIIMSATLKLDDFMKNKRLFDPPPPVVRINARQHPVTILYNKHTVEDYIGEAYRKICKIHQTKQRGGILVFVTGQEEVNALCRKLKRAFSTAPSQIKRRKLSKKTDEKEVELEEENQLERTLRRLKRSRTKKTFDELPKINLDDYSTEDEDGTNENVDEESEDCLDSSGDDLPAIIEKTAEPLHVLPLYSILPAKQQAKVFEQIPSGHRLCVISTNVAETSLTVPNIKYVVDTGKVKRRMYDKVTGISTFVVTWISKASAKQRAGRAGRTSAGYCYRLYSSAIHENDFPDFFEPEILQRPIDDIVLQLKFMRIDRVVDFPFPRSPDVESIKAAEERLVLLGALEKHLSNPKKREWTSTITPFGETMACISVSPRYSKMITLSNQKGLLPYTIAVVAALTVQEMFLDHRGSTHTDEEMEQLSEDQNRWKNLRMSWAAEGHSQGLGDVTTMLEAIRIVENKGCTPDECYSHGVRYKAMMEIRKLRKQLTNEVNAIQPQLNLIVDPDMIAPTDLQKKILRQIILSGMADHVARKIPEGKMKDKKKYKNAYECLQIEEPVFIHPDSVLFRQLPEYVMYQEIIETSRHYMRIVSAVESNWLPVICQRCCTFSDPLDEPPPRYDRSKDEIRCHMKSTFGWRNWPIGIVEVQYPKNDEMSIKLFSHFFLKGEVYPSMKKYSEALLSSSSVVTKQWCRVVPRARNLVNAFLRYRIDSKKSLEDVWKKDPKYLLKEYLEWLPESISFEVSEKWPPL